VIGVQPTFLSLAEVLAIHRDQIERYGGEPGVRSFDLLRSALGVPEAGVREGYLHSDFIEMAAAYLFHIVRDHPFVDGNKRVGAMSAYVFLALNGVELRAPEEAFESLVMGVASGDTKKSAVAEFLRTHAR
jgi:death-on-curing protein